MAKLFQAQITSRITDFLVTIGIHARPCVLDEPTFLPGIAIFNGELLIDEAKLRYPGDLLHEAGHLAVVPADVRNTISGKIVPENGQEGGEEMAAIAWSYAAAVHLELAPSVVFHECGYKGESRMLLENFTNGRYLGVPMLQWLGMTMDGERAQEAGVEPYPHMLMWVR